MSEKKSSSCLCVAKRISKKKLITTQHFFLAYFYKQKTVRRKQTKRVKKLFRFIFPLMYLLSFFKIVQQKTLSKTKLSLPFPHLQEFSWPKQYFDLPRFIFKLFCQFDQKKKAKKNEFGDRRWLVRVHKGSFLHGFYLVLQLFQKCLSCIEPGFELIFGVQRPGRIV